MNKYTVNLSTIFTEVPFLERFKKARDFGFSYVECQFPYISSIIDIQQELEQHQLAMVLLNLPPGNWEKGDRGIAADPTRVNEFRRSVHEGIKYATALKVSKIHCMAGIVSEVNTDKARETYKDNLHYAGTEMAKHGLTILIEPINQYDMPGYFLNDIREAEQILKEVDLPNVKLQFDFYHIERVHGNSLSIYKQYADIVGHVQIADVPGRHQPGTGEMDYQKVIHYLNDTYEGFIGLEYTPHGKSEESFEWLSWISKGEK
ncbi:hydroxypyruvate isomerase [Bacillus sp. SLBN-46]|uniref:hydroxypyruvate isomerase family protein n=1 Tax=Bacillus sp. SLBN-46 TaxID=3042283 RepID=UPI0028597812|nr:TIM barrel protein [Bacillus sp. SLBN-46]MDR6121768.1 hydroxypyruvate isomerase [Bacillus sp. SLBN-46]